MSSSRTIKTIGIQTQGELDVIEELQRPAPAPTDDQVVIRVEYAGVNFIDTYERAGVVSASTLMCTPDRATY